MISRRLGGLGAALMLVSSLMVAQAQGAAAINDTDSKSYPNGAVITANVWMQTFSWTWRFDFKSSAIITKRPVWIKDVASFHAHGIGASIGALSTSGGSADYTLSWTNSNGALGAYLSGSIKVSKLTIWVTACTTANALQYGTSRVAMACVL